MITWDPVEAIDCWGVLPVEDEYGSRLTYAIAKHGLRLVIFVEPYDGDVHASLFRDGISTPVLDFHLANCDAARRLRERSVNAMEFAGGRLFGGRYDGEAPIPYGVRIQVEPAIRLEFFHRDP